MLKAGDRVPCCPEGTHSRSALSGLHNNFPMHDAVDSALVDDLDDYASSFFCRMTVRLAVAGAFHTDFMQPAVEKLQAALAQTEVK
eukprot:1157352-Pelagomonas_calceolata.AAC.9